MRIWANRWLLGVSVLWLLLCWYPLAAGMVASSDDIAYLRLQYAPGHLWPALVEQWHGALFRPLIVVLAFVTDPLTREGSAVVGLHAAAIACGAVAVFRLASRWGGEGERTAWLAVALWLLHPSTAVATWQMDTLSQTACAAVGLWLLVRAGQSPNPAGRDAWWWGGLTVVGLLTKETFLGWILVASLVRLFRAGAGGCSRYLGPLLGLALALAYVGMRFHAVSGLSGGGGRYAVQSIVGLGGNLGLATAGLLAFGPSHAVHSFGVSSVSSWVILAATLLHLAVVIRSALGNREACLRIAGLWAIATCSLAPVLLLTRLSELYLQGPNALVAIALASGLQRRGLGRRWVAGAILVAGTWGQVSRAHHFGLTWRYSRELALQVAAMTRSGRAPEVRDQPCRAGELHSVYVVEPLNALNVQATELLMMSRGTPLAANWWRGLDCRALPQRGRW